MARSSYIYVVTNKGELRAAFTVKHELVSWLDRHDDDQLSEFELWRCQDGVYKDKAPRRMPDPRRVQVKVTQIVPGTAQTPAESA
jgi:hypothetical protein